MNGGALDASQIRRRIGCLQAGTRRRRTSTRGRPGVDQIDDNNICMEAANVSNGEVERL